MKRNPVVVVIQLSIMMFIQFFIWGAWYVTGPRFLGPLGFEGSDFGWMYSVGPIAGIISPLFVGMFADRFFATERVMGVMHIFAGLAMFAAAEMMKVTAPSPMTINLLFFAHMFCYFPTLALVNSLSMHNMTNPEKQFPLVRVFGTIGWIAAGLTLTLRGWGNSIEMFYLAATACIVLGVFSFTLPHTPPPLKGKKTTVREALGLDALVMLKQRSFFIFMMSSFLICIPLAFYYQMAERTLAQAGIANPELKMTFGQMSEIFFMLVMPLFFARLGVKWMLVIGMLAWVVRYGLFAVGAPDAVVWMLLTGVIFHGICYDFFFVTGQIYTDKAAPKEIRAQAQGMLVLFTLGLGMLIGAQIGGRVEVAYPPDETRKLNEQAGDVGNQMEKIQVQLDKTETEDAGIALEAELETLEKERKGLVIRALQAISWREIWTIPAVGAAVVLIIFTLIFKEDTPEGGSAEGSQPAAG